MQNQQPMQMSGQGNQVFQPLTTKTFGEHKDDFVKTLMDKFENGRDFKEGEAAAVTALGNIFTAKSTTTTTSNRQD